MAGYDYMLKMGLSDHAVVSGRDFRQQLESLAVAFPGTIREVRGVGMMIGLELSDGQADKFIRQCWERTAIHRPRTPR